MARISFALAAAISGGLCLVSGALSVWIILFDTPIGSGPTLEQGGPPMLGWVTLALTFGFATLSGWCYDRARR